MRFSSAAASLYISLLPATAGFAADATPPKEAAPASSASTAAAGADAAARHARRTACLRQAKDKKLVGADKTAFLKTCIEQP